jgi:hypothetical protein
MEKESFSGERGLNRKTEERKKLFKLESVSKMKG